MDPTTVGDKHLPFVILVVLAIAPMAALAQPAAKRSGSGTPADRASLERRLLDGVQQNPGSFQAQHLLASFYLHDGKVRAALPHLQRAAALNPSSYEIGYDLGQALLESGRLAEADAHVRGWLARKDVGELHNLLGDIQQRAGDLKGAAAEYQTAAHMDPSEEHLFDWGDDLLQLGAYEPAIEVFTAAVKRFPRSARLHVGRGVALYAGGVYRDAVLSFCEAADLAPSDPRPYQFLGEMYGVSAEVAGEVTTRLGRFVETHPRNALAHFQYAMSLSKGSDTPTAGELRRIEQLLRRSVQLDPKLSRGYFELGVLLANQQRSDEAIEALRTATRLQPSYSQAHYRLGQLYQRTGRKDLAAKEFAAFRQLTAAAPETAK
jgi:tetratricopeptide (TPR) repeat protein